jgi:3-oxoacyl-[acyl-carrier-protein] synthase-1
MRALPITALSAANALGRGLAASLEALRQGRSGLRRNDFDDAALPTWIGRVDGLERSPVPRALAEFDCRNNRLAQAALEVDGFAEAVGRARRRHGAHRIAVLIGTSTSGILQTELAYREREAAGQLPAWLNYRGTHNLYSVTDFVRRSLGLAGPAATVSTACSSSAKVFASAHRLLEAGLADAAVVGGVDSLCLTTLYGFSSLELLSTERCMPFDQARKGLSIGEAAGFALLERGARSRVALLGYGESSDAHHMSAPHPEGAGARRAMQAALASAGIEPRAIDYINAHGTATPANDRAEDRAIFELFGGETPVSSTKGLTGHALGAAGISEAVICCLALEHGLLPGTANSTTIDAAMRSRVVIAPESRRLARALSNSFGFGGSNCSLVFGVVE